jgi:hypothetical protein
MASENRLVRVVVTQISDLMGCLTARLRNRGYYPDGLQLKDWLAAYLASGRHVCPICNENGTKRRMGMKVTLNDVPPIIVFDIVHEKLRFDDELHLEVQGTRRVLALRGNHICGQGHFTCRVIGRDGTMWFRDGITTGSSCISEVNVRTLHRSILHTCGEKRVVSVVYARVE